MSITSDLVGTPAVTNFAPLSPENAVILQKLEKTIEAGLQTFVAVGEALAKIRDLRLYLATHVTFAHYCEDRWKFSRQRAHQLIGAAEVAASLSTRVDIHEKALRPLVPLPVEERREVWAKAEALAGPAPVSTKHVVAALQKNKVVDKVIEAEVPTRKLAVVKGNSSHTNHTRFIKEIASDVSRAATMLQRIKIPLVDKDQIAEHLEGAAFFESLRLLNGFARVLETLVKK